MTKYLTTAETLPPTAYLIRFHKDATVTIGDEYFAVCVVTERLDTPHTCEVKGMVIGDSINLPLWLTLLLCWHPITTTARVSRAATHRAIRVCLRSLGFKFAYYERFLNGKLRLAKCTVL